MLEINKDILNGLWPVRSNDNHKGTYGRILIVAGNDQYGGAGILSSSAAVYAGGGLVTLATTKANFTAVRSTLAEIMLLDFLDFTALEAALSKSTGIVIGPGLGTDATSLKILNFVLEHIQPKTPLVIDGSAIDLIATHQIKVDHPLTIFTPHQMEWQRLSGIQISDQTPSLNQTKVNELNALVVLKHFETEIYTPKTDFRRILAGNPGMATGGSGDVLTGVIIALVNQVESLELGVTLGTFLHSYVADQIYQEEAIVLPHRLIRHIPKILKQLQK
jgi:ADP-dependent NAD(P)H-hydrate dehydratase